MTTEDDYLRSVERMLRGIAPEHRTAVLEDLRGHFADAEDAGLPVDETIRGLGSPKEIADRALEEFDGVDAGAVKGRAERAWRVLQGSAVVLAVVIGVVVAFILPTHTIASSGDGGSSVDHLTVLQNDGIWVALLTLIPAMIAAVPVLVSQAARLAVSVICAMLVTVLMFISMWTIGGFFLPVVLMSWAALIVWARMRTAGFGIVWRIAGGALTALPVLAGLGSFGIPPGFGGPLGFGIPRRYADYTEAPGPSIGIEGGGWVLLAGLLALGVLIAVGYRWAGWALAALGAAVLVTGLVSGGLLTLLVIWLGGWWLTIGLAHAVATTRLRDVDTNGTTGTDAGNRAQV